MNINECQHEMRSAFWGGFAGQLVSGIIWLAASVISLWAAPRYGMAALFFGSMLIFPLTQLTVRMMGRPGKVSPDNGLWQLGSQTAFTVPLNFLLVGAATLYRETWFFPAAMIVVDSHYLPFNYLVWNEEVRVAGWLVGPGRCRTCPLRTSRLQLGQMVDGCHLDRFRFSGKAYCFSGGKTRCIPFLNTISLQKRRSNRPESSSNAMYPNIA